jgi:hypothetical protein
LFGFIKNDIFTDKYDLFSTILAMIKINKIDDTLADFLCVMFYKDEKGKRKKIKHG